MSQVRRVRQAGGPTHEASEPSTAAPISEVKTVDQQRALDAIVQTSTIELFQSYEVAIAPVGIFIDLDKLDPGALGGQIPFSGSAMSGELVLAVPKAVLAAMGHEHTLAAQDWVRELTNQLLGRVKNRLVRYDVRLRPGVPLALDHSEVRARLDSDAARAYMFRSLRGSVFVALRGTMAPGSLRFKGSEAGPEEGDMLVF
jgi:hypothetical protein